MDNGHLKPTNFYNEEIMTDIGQTITMKVI